ncbi:SCO0607 family lipoprotein [Streptomyces sp. NPDC001744]|uniref:SCO0607 family lipoprotein n=1 Tax=Streptomyces sp. NPDC001744 TaxID=3364606 RepID=UPI003686DBD6
MRVPGRTRHAAAVPRSVRGRVVVALAGAASVVPLAGCAGTECREDVCGGGEYPVLSVGGTGSARVPDAEEPPAGFARYPAGKVPRQVGDERDAYGDTPTLDKDGKVLGAPAGE